MPPSGTGRSPNAHLSHNEHGLAGWGEAPLGSGHINFHGFYPFHRPDLDGGLRDLRDPDTTDVQE